MHFAECPNCHKIVVSVEHLDRHETGNKLVPTPDSEFLCWPLLGASRPVPPEVPDAIAKDYRHAALALNLIPEASAALSRRCLQGVLRERGYSYHVAL